MTSEFCVAVHALAYLNRHPWTVSSETLAVNICTNPARVRRVLSGLKKAGLVDTREGAEGGYRLARPPEEVSLAGVARALGVQFVGAAWRSGDPDMDCLVASGMAGLMDGLYGELDALCYQRLEALTLADIDRRLPQGGTSAAPAPPGAKSNT